jgi:cysteine desulfurase
MNLRENITEGALRISIGKFTTKEEVEKASFAIASAVKAILSLK